MLSVIEFGGLRGIQVLALFGEPGERNKERILIFLANLAEDPGEQKNLANQHPNVVARLKELHEKYLSN